MISNQAGKVLARLPFTSNIADLLYAPDGSLILTADGLVRVTPRGLSDPALLGKAVPDDVWIRNGFVPLGEWHPAHRD
jgi:hypothetical protein